MELENKKPSNPRLHNPDGMYASEARNEDCVTLRDIFANSAIQKPVITKPRGIFNYIKWFFGLSYRGNNLTAEVIAQNAYCVADAMLKEREL